MQANTSITFTTMTLPAPVSPFRLFARPQEFSTYQLGPETCDCCGETGPAFTGPFQGEDEVECVCENCLRQGKLADSGAWCNDGDFGVLRDQIIQLHPALKTKDVDRLVEDRIAELLERTPPLVTWTEFPWPVRDGDWCRFEQEVGMEDLQTAANTDGASSLDQWFGEHLDSELSDDASPAELIKLIRPGSLTDNSTYHPTGAYLFRSTVTGRAVVVVDRE
jgi:uncharacterized protein CbrC (UPF0167 family)